MAGYAQWHWRALSLSAPCSTHSAKHVPVSLRWNPLSAVCLMCKRNGQIDVDAVVLCEYNLVCVCVAYTIFVVTWCTLLVFLVAVT